MIFIGIGSIIGIGRFKSPKVLPNQLISMCIGNSNDFYWKSKSASNFQCPSTCKNK
jgi:hypothetical protein